MAAGAENARVLSLTRKTDYALLALVDMVRSGSMKVSARVLSERLDVPLRVLTNILSQLTHHGLVSSTRGVKGGYSLAKDPAEISVAELIAAVEGPMRLTACCADPQDGQGRLCRAVDECHLTEPIRKLQDNLIGYLARVTLEDLACNSVPTRFDGNG